MDEPLEEEPAAAASSAASSTSSPFAGDRGPGFSPDAQPPHVGEEPLTGPVLGVVEIVPEEKVRSILLNGGDLLHAGIGVGELDWVMTEKDQDRIAPPLTRIINKHEQLAAIAGRSDELAVAIGTGLYAWRSLLEREAILKAQRRAETTPEPEPEPPPAPAPDAQPDFRGLGVAPDYVPEAIRRFGQRPGGTPQ